MIQTLIVYLVLSILMIALMRMSASYPVDNKEKYIPAVIAITLYSMLFGLRYGVGVDHLAYLNEYLDIQNGYKNTSIENEILFSYFTNTLANSNIHFSFYFGILAFLQLALIFYSFKNIAGIYPYLAFTIMFGCVWLTYMNGIRQQIAFCIFVFAIKYIVDKKFWKYLVICVIAFFVHKSAVLLIFFYPLYRKRVYFENVKVQLLLLIISLVLMRMPLAQMLLLKLDVISLAMGYSGYLDKIQNGDLSNVVSNDSLGAGFFIILFIDFVIIYFSNRVKSYLNSRKYSIIYDICYIGILWHYIFNSSLLLGRLNYYMYGFQFIVFAFTMYYVVKSKLKYSLKKQILTFMVTLYFLLFAGYMKGMENNSAQYVFFWQDDLYYIKAPLTRE